MARTELFVRKASGALHVVAHEGITTGTIFFVSSGVGTDTSGYGLSPDTPVATIDYAIGLCTASKFDRIYVMPGHTETLSAAGSITADVAGVSIIGLGQGTNAPTLNFANTAATVAVTAANVSFKNLRVTSTVDEVVKMFNVTGANCTIDEVVHFETASCQTNQFLLATSANYLTIKNCHHTQATAATGTQKWIQLSGGSFARILDNVFMLTLRNETASHIISGSTAVTLCEIARNVFILGGGTTQNTIVNLVTTSTGFIHRNVAGSSTGVSTAGAFTGDACYFAENYWADTVAASGLLAPVVDTDT